MNVKQSIHLLSVLSAFFLLTNIHAATDANVNTSQIENVVHDYLIKNPDVVVQSLEAYQQKQMVKAEETIRDTQKNAPEFANALFHQNNDPITGNKAGKISIVEFFDYQCSHCINVASMLESFIHKNSDVKIIFKDFPIRGPMSNFAAKAALAANLQNKYTLFHHALMETAAKNLPLTEDLILNAAKTAGLDINKLKVDMNNKEIEQQLKTNMQLAQQLKLMGTPAFFIAASNVDQKTPADKIVFVPGELNEVQLQQIIAKVSH